jgi:hypothetical protein
MLLGFAAWTWLELKRVQVRVFHHESQSNWLAGQHAYVTAHGPFHDALDFVAE